MIIEFFIDMVRKVVEWLLGVFPDMPSETLDFTTAFSGFGSQMATVNTFFPLDTLATMVALIFTVDILIGSFHFFRWIFAKIPIIGGHQ